MVAGSASTRSDHALAGVLSRSEGLCRTNLAWCRPATIEGTAGVPVRLQHILSGLNIVRNREGTVAETCFYSCGIGRQAAGNDLLGQVRTIAFEAGHGVGGYSPALQGSNRTLLPSLPDTAISCFQYARTCHRRACAAVQYSNASPMLNLSKSF
jgi:hypothetical protein